MSMNPSASSAAATSAASVDGLGGSNCLHQLLQHTSNGVCGYDLQGRVQWVNPAFEELTGYRAEDLAGQVLSEFLTGEDSDRTVIARMHQQFELGEPSDEELLHHDANGRPLRLRLRCIPLMAADGTLTGYLGVHTDVTQAHLALELSHSQLRLLESVTAGQPLDKTLLDLCQAIEAVATRVRSSLLLLDKTGTRIIGGKAPSLPPSFMQFTSGLRIGEGVGTCGTAMWRREQVLTPAIGEDPAWEGFRHHPHALGLDACLSMPILDDAGNPLGSFAFYATSGDVFNDSHLGLLKVAVNVARLAIERHRRDEQLTYQALHDALTGLPNRRLLRRKLGAFADLALEEARVGALMFLDLDHFKRLNDVLGHDAGDRALIQIAARLEQLLEPGDVLARQGGDEFIVLLAPRFGGMEDARARAMHVGEGLLARLRVPVELEGRAHQLSGSLGITLYPRPEEAGEGYQTLSGAAEDEGDDWGHLLHEADIALYESKGAGRARMCFFSPDMRNRIIAATQMEQSLRSALSRQHLEVHLQPQFSLQSDASLEHQLPRLCGLEALLRWNDPLLGNVSPATFIPIAEESGLIVELGHWVLGQACAVLEDMATRGHQLPIAVNVSQVQFRSAEFVPQVAALLKRHAFAPDMLRMEITESLAAEDEADMLEKVDQLAALGLTFSIDDFGIGYSNLARLRRMPLSELKIDRSFIKDLRLIDDDGLAAPAAGETPGQEVCHANEIVRAMLVMARALSLEVVAEGVETSEQFEVLRQLGCQRVQGYLLGRPRPMKDVLDEIEAGVLGA
ncbi:EAL domain-containing protein [Cobetia marina]|nr:EAL domain-containing protein [Cobetia marina]